MKAKSRVKLKADTIRYLFQKPVLSTMVYSETQNIKQLQHLNPFSQLPQNSKDTKYPDTILGVP